MFSSISKHSLRANTVRRLKDASKGAMILVALSLAFCGSPIGAMAGVETDPNLLKLEMKFFQHDYSKEDVVARLDRIEKLVYGEVRSGDPATRLKNLVAAVPTLNDTPVASDSSASQASGADSGTPTASAPRSKRSQAPQAAPDPDSEMASREQQISGGSSYPQVSAMEKKLLGHDYGSEPIVKRLERLETKAFGKVSESDDLSERVDRLKARTGIDLATTPPPGSDWSDDDEGGPMGGGDLTYVPAQTTPYTPSRVPATNLGGGGSSYSGRGGGYGMGGSSSSGDDSAVSSPGGGYGYNPPRKIASITPRTAPPGMPQPAPDIVREPQGAPPAAMGLNQRIAMLENTLYNKTFTSDTLPARLARLENTVFPGRRAAPDMSLPERVARLAEVVGPGDGPAPAPQGSNQRVAQRGGGNDDTMSDPNMPPVAPQRAPSALSKIINGLGNLVTGGGGYGAYPMGGSNLVTDPQTGMLIDTYSGNIIDPRTGAVVGTRGMGMPVSPYGGTYNSAPYSGFNNGLSPIGSPYGSSYGGSRMGVGFGSGGMRFGSGFGMGSGFGGAGGMGMGTGLIWP